MHDLHAAVPLTTQSGYLLAGTYNATSAAQKQQPGVWLPASFDAHDASLIAAHPTADSVRVVAALISIPPGFLHQSRCWLQTTASATASAANGTPTASKARAIAERFASSQTPVR